MAEEQVVTQVYQQLVLQNEREKLLSKLQDMQLKNLTEKQREYWRRHIRNFISLSYSFFGLSKKQLSKLDEAEIKELTELVGLKARPWAICQMIFTFGVPIIGWGFGSVLLSENEFKSWNYIRSGKYLRKNSKNDYFPFDIFKEKLE